MNNDEYVDVVTPLADVWAVIALVCYGMMMGFVAGLGYSYFDILDVKNDAPKANIVGNVTVRPDINGEISFSGTTVIDGGMTIESGMAIQGD